MIPRIIHQTWKNTDLPDVWKETPMSWKELNPGYKYMFWTDEDISDFVSTNFPQYVEMMNNFDYPIQRVDAVRYMWMYQYGGIYVDLDIACKRSIEPLLQFYENVYGSEVILVSSSNAQSVDGVTNAVLISKVKSQFWIDVLEYIKTYTPSVFNVFKYSRVMFSTGPEMLNKMYREKKGMYNISTIPYEYMSACTMCDLKPCNNPLSFVNVLQGQSWHGVDGHIIKKVYCMPVMVWRLIFTIILLILLCLYLWNRKKLAECRQSCPLVA